MDVLMRKLAERQVAVSEIFNDNTSLGYADGQLCFIKIHGNLSVPWRFKKAGQRFRNGTCGYIRNDMRNACYISYSSRNFCAERIGIF